MLNTDKIRTDFPIYSNYPDIVYLDSGASSLKPRVVIESITEYYEKYGVNIHRGVYDLSVKATDKYDEARQKIANFLDCDFEEVIFTRGASSSLNLVAFGYGMEHINKGDEIIVTELEHHSSVLPWQQVAKRKQAKLVYIPLDEDGRITIENFKKVLTKKTKVISITMVSNVMGYISPIKEMIQLAHEVGAVVSVDGAQSAPHMKINVRELDIDFYSISAHKMCGPTGIGALYGKKDLLTIMNPIEFGGDMNDEVNLFDAKFKEIPYKFETGTMPISQAIGFGQAITYLESIGFDNIRKHELKLHEYALDKLKDLEGITVYNPKSDSGIITFNIDGVHSHDSATGFAENNICLRAGHHCAELITKWLHVSATLRVTFYLYNDKKDVDRFIDTAIEVRDFFKEFL